jgi:hypothetical protein
MSHIRLALIYMISQGFVSTFFCNQTLLIKIQELVWSGAPLVQNRNAFDFRVIDVDGSPHLSFILGSLPQEDQDTATDPLGVGIITDCSYNIRSRVPIRAGMADFNMHEFKVFDGGRKSLMVTKKLQQENDSTLTVAENGDQMTNDGFQEVDLKTGATVFEWNSLDQGISVSETTRTEDAWDYMCVYQD